MNQRIVLVLILCVIHWASKAQELTVRSQASHEPLELVTIFSLDKGTSAITDARGRADISHFAGADSIVIRFIGFETAIYRFEDLKEKDFTIFLKESLFSLDEVVVSAVGWDQFRRETPQRIISVKPAEVQLQNPQTAADLLGLSGQVFIQKSQMGGGSPMIRGFAANRVLLAVDGVRMNNAIFRSGNLQNVISLDPFAIEKAEVVFGPGSVIYGSDAIGGVMSFRTLRPKLANGEEMVIRGSSTLRWSSANREKTSHVDVNLGWKKWALTTSLSYSDFGDLRMGRHGPEEYLRPEYVETVDGTDRVVTNADPRLQVPTGYEQLNLMQKVRFVPNGAWDLQYGFHYATTGDYPRYDRLIRYRADRLRSAEWYYGPQVWMMHNLHALHHNESALFDQMALTLAYQHFEESRHDRDFGSDIRSNRWEEVDVLSANLDFEKTWNTDQRLFYGAEALLNFVGSMGTDENILTEISAPGPSRYPDDATWHSLAAYVNYRQKVTSQLTLQGGLRYNRVLLNAAFDNTFFPFPFSRARINTGALSGSLGATWLRPDSWQFNLNLSSGFRAPNVDDVGKVFDSEPGAVVVPNPNLRPEYAWNAELGTSKIVGDWLKWDASVYYTFLDDAMVRRNYTLDGRDQILYEGELSRVQAIQNAAFAQVYGLQTALELRLPAGFNLLSRFNWQTGEEELDDGATAPLRHAPPWFGATHLKWEGDQLRLDLYFLYNGEVSNANLAPGEQRKDFIYAIDENGRPYAPAWYTLNLKARYQLIENVSAHVGLENITDQRYRPYSSGIVAPGRNLILSLRAAF